MDSYSTQAELDNLVSIFVERVEAIPDGKIKNTGEEIIKLLPYLNELIINLNDPLITDTEKQNIIQEIVDCYQIIADYKDLLEQC